MHILAGGSPTISISVVSQYISILWLYLLVIYFNISFYLFFIIHLFYFIFILFFLLFSLLTSYVQENENIAVRSRYNFYLSPSPHDNCSPCRPVARVRLVNTMIIREKSGRIFSDPLTKIFFFHSLTISSLFCHTILSTHARTHARTHTHTQIRPYISE